MIFTDFDTKTMIQLNEIGCSGRFINMMGDEYDVDRLTGYAVRKGQEKR